MRPRKIPGKGTEIMRFLLKIIYSFYLIIIFNVITIINNKLNWLHFIFSQGTATEDYFNEAILQKIRTFIRKLVFYRVNIKHKMMILKEEMENI